VKGEVEANVSVEVRVARGVDVAWAAGVGAAEGPGSDTRPEKMEGMGVDVVLWTEAAGVAGKERVLITVGFGVDGWGTWTAEETWPGNTGRTALDMFSPETVAAADADGWFTALTGDAVGMGVAAGVEGLEPWGEKSWLAGLENAVEGEKRQEFITMLKCSIWAQKKCVTIFVTFYKYQRQSMTDIIGSCNT
jgi:hypothetical protein